jgi:hypothetical protein
MDELVERLGYMDYRDALACNKYLIDVKRHGDYHQQARAKILTVALSRYNSQKRVQLEARAQAAAKTPADKDEAKLKLIMDEDAEMAKLYREAYGDIKADKEADYNEAARIHDKYSYQKRGEGLKGSAFDLSEEKKSLEEEMLTTELSDEGLDLVYKRYKMMKWDNSDALRDLDEEAAELFSQYNSGLARNEDESEIRGPLQLENAIGLLVNKKHNRVRLDTQLEGLMAQVKFMHAMKKLDPYEVYNEEDPNFRGIVPSEDTRDSEHSAAIPAELRKLYKAFPEWQSNFLGVAHDEVSQRNQEDLEELSTKYFRAKWDFYMAEKLKMMQITTKDIAEAQAYYGENGEGKDAMVKSRFEFMYTFMDYDNDRARVRERFLKDENKTTLKDIGQLLDKFLLDERAESARFLDVTKTAEEHIPKSAAKDTDSFQMSWSGKIFRDMDPLKPLLIDDHSELDEMPEGSDTPYRDIVERIKYEDARTDYSKRSLTADQKTEIALFHSFKQDPFYKHFLHNHMRQYAEDMDEGILNFPDGPFTRSVMDIPKFDRLNLYDFRRALPMKDREAKLDQAGGAWGFGKRKTSRAVVRVKAGKGVININGMPMLDYFTLASQRYRILLPLMITQYTCLLDVDIWVHGGGHTGQPEAIVPGLAKAI